MKKVTALTIFLCACMSFGGCVVSPEISENMGAGTSSTSNSSISSEVDSTVSSEVDSDASSELDSTTSSVIETDEMSVHFLELGNKYTGDCTLIKVGDTEVLIDAGSRKNSAATISAYLDEHCTDGVLEYVIATHAHEDHIAGFVGKKQGNARDGILYNYTVETLIQFARTDYALTTDKGNPTLYSEYVDAVAYAEGQGTQVYSALDCWKEENGGQKTYYLNESQTISMNILYNYFYENKTSGGGGENEYSVCMLLTYGADNFLFTGDLEEKGEEYLVEYNNLPKCTLFKGGHHGSYTATSEELLQVIQPEIVCVCCCCGSTEYTTNMANVFPAQAFIDRVAPYTDKVYVTTVIADNTQGFQSLNGNIVVQKKDGLLSVEGSNNNTLFKDTDWFKEHRTMPEAWK